MFNPTLGPARELLSTRTRLDADQLAQLESAGALIIDDRRRRPLYFDGRFLAARDLTRDQQYVLLRQAALGRAGGSGVVAGLMVGFDLSRNHLTIDPGHGVTGSGEPVVIGAPVALDPAGLERLRAFDLPLNELPRQQRLDISLGLGRVPAEPGRARSGLFIIALRPVEFTANPIAAYPTTVTGQRSVEDSDIVEATAVTLIPYYADSGAGNLDQRRARAAYDIFIDSGRPLGDQVLPLAMVALDQLQVRWLDPFMVRREVGSDHGDLLGLGFAPRAAREAFALQYDAHLAEVLAQRGRSAFAASSHFLALPPAGRMPAAAINPDDFSQTYFPAEVEVELSIVPSDEIAALVEESLNLPPIDLTLPAEAQESTSLLALLAVPRASLRRLKNSLTTLSRTLRPAAPGLVARRTPIEALSLLRPARPLIPLAQPPDPVEETWRQLLGAATTLWYVRRRNLAYSAEIIGTNLWMYSNEVADEQALDARVARLGLQESFGALKDAGSTAADAEIVSTLMSPRFAESRLLSEALLFDLQTYLSQIREAGPGPTRPTLPTLPTLPTRPLVGGIDPRVIAARLRGTAIAAAGAAGVVKLSLADVLVVTERYANPHLGEGIARARDIWPELDSDPNATDVADEEVVVVRTVAQCGLVPEFDQLCRRINANALRQLVTGMQSAVAAGSSAKVADVIGLSLKENPQ